MFDSGRKAVPSGMLRETHLEPYTRGIGWSQLTATQVATESVSNSYT